MRLLAAWSVLLLAGCSDRVTLPLLYDATDGIQANAMLTKRFTLGEEQEVRWDWTSDADVSFKAFHEGGRTIFSGAGLGSHSGHAKGHDGGGALILQWTSPGSQGAQIHIVLHGDTARPAATVSDP